jgi:hypothetical protein
MIFTKYYAWMPKATRNDGSAVMRAYESVQTENEVIVDRSKGLNAKREPKSSPLKKKDLHQNDVSP